MKVDDRLRRAADEVREAGREARFTVRAPGSRPFWARPVVVFSAAAAVALAIGVPLLLLHGPWRGRVLGPGPTTTLATTTLATTTTGVPTTTTLAPGETPVASVEELVTGIFAALTAGDAGSFQGLFADDTWHGIYTVQGGAGDLVESVDNDTYLPVGEAWEVLGDVTVAGNVAVTPVQATYPETRDTAGAWVGFDVTVVEAVPGGFLGGIGIALLAEVNAPGYAETDPAVVEELLAAQAAAWAVGDIDGVLAGYWEMATYMDGLTFGTISAAEMADFYAGMRLGFVGEPVISGPFFAVVTRVTDLASGVVADGVSLYWVREGQIALHVLTTGT